MPKRLIVSVFRLLKLDRAIRNFAHLAPQEKKQLIYFLSASGSEGAPPELKLKICEAILLLRAKTKKSFGLFIILGWRREWNERYLVQEDVTQNVFQKERANFKDLSPSQISDAIKRTVDFDGAILVNEDGVAIHSGVYLENLKPKRVAQILRRGRADDLSGAFGFRKKVHARHLAAIAASYALKRSTVFVVSEEDRSVRILEKGRIIWSTVHGEAGMLKFLK